LDELLKLPGAIGNTGKSSFPLFDEQILKILIAGGIPGPEAYATVKAIKKKKIEKVLAEKEKFKHGFDEKLMREDGATAEEAGETVEKIWTIIENAASYMF
jgi:DNA polymerase III alpha subunit